MALGAVAVPKSRLQRWWTACKMEKVILTRCSLIDGLIHAVGPAEGLTQAPC